MAKSNSPKKVLTPKNVKPPPGKTVLPKQKQIYKQRRFSIIDSDSSSLSEFDSDDEDMTKNSRPKKVRDFNTFSGKFQAIQSESEDEESENENESDEEQIWKSNSKKVVNTSSEEENDDDDDEDDEEEDDDDDDSSSSDDEDVDFVKLSAERKKRSLERRSNSPFHSISPSKDNDGEIFGTPPQQDVDFSFDFNNNDHQLKITNEEEDVGEELAQFSPIKDNHIIPLDNEPLGFMNIEESSESDGEINRDDLLRTLEQDSDDGLDTGIETGDDELNVLKHEADVIAQDYDEDGLQLNNSSNITFRNPVVENMIKKHKSEMQNNEALQYVSDDEYDSQYEDSEFDDDNDDDHDTFMIPYFDDSGFKDHLYLTDHHQNKKNSKDDLDSEDDSYLWDYFFSSGEEDEDDANPNTNNHNGHNYSDDETTDEDITLPPPSSRKKIGSKAQELLSSSSVAVRPPTLGTWSTDSKPFGIIDGLSTRSLLPNKNSIINNNNNNNISSSLSSSLPIESTTVNNKSGVTPITNNIEELNLDELLNMSEMEDGDGDDLDYEMWLEVTNSSNRSVPLSAFRNKGIVDDHDSHINATRRFSSSHHHSNGSKSVRLRHGNNGDSQGDSTVANGKKKGQKTARFNEVSISPVSKNPKKKNRRNSVKMRRRQSIAEAAVEGLRVTKSGLFSEDTLNNVEEFLSGLGNETELSILFREVQ